jgi:uncharacterized membrane protein YgdD (TMEM256/DUF423 family)
MQKSIMLSGITFAALAVMLGAFGAHALKEKISPENLQVFETGVRYQFYHALALILLALAAEKYSNGPVQLSAILFITGIVFFSGSIYLLSTRELLGIESWKKILGPITPLGGLSLILAWISFFISVWKGSE